MPVYEPEEIDPVYAEAVHRGDADAVLSLYEAGAAFVLHTGETISGVDAIRETVNGLLAMKPRMDLKTKKVIKGSDVALVYSDWTLSGTAEDGSAINIAGNTTLVLRKQPDGTWRLAIDDPGWSTT